MDTTKKITLKLINGEDVRFTVDSFVSQWHSERMADAYEPFYKYYDKEKGKVDTEAIPAMEKLSLNRHREKVLLETFVKEWTLQGVQPTVENIKKNLHPDEYQKLVVALDEIYTCMTAEKKTTSPNDSSSDSSPTVTPTEQ